jgi:sulfide:quinone oxidoreductase
MPRHVVILGAGFGGLELSTRLSDELADEVHVTLIDKNDSFIFGFSKLDVMLGRSSLDDVRHHYRDIAKPSVEFRQEAVTSIDPHTRRVVTDGGTYDADILVVALGADVDPSATPGFVEGGYEFYTPEGASHLQSVLPNFSAGNVVIGVLGGFFKCPPAPYEAAFLLHDYLVERGVRDNVTMRVTTPLPSPIPVSADTSQAITTMLAERDIDYSPSTWVTRLDPSTKIAHLKDGTELPYDLFLGVPVHCAPRVVVESGLTEDDGWIAVDKATLATKFPNVYAVGDVASAPVPRAGAIAEGEAGTVADVLVAQLKGGPAAEPFKGEVLCYIEMGDERIGKVNVNFLSGPAPDARFTPPTVELRAEKKLFGSSRRARWFGN